MSHKICLLIVDDEVFNLALLDIIFDKDEFVVVRARDGLEALQKLSQMERCDAILLDRMMPEMDGIEVLKAIKGDSRYCNIPVIMQTAAGSAEQVKEAMDAGAFAYILKPYDEISIVALVKDALQAANNRKRDIQTQPS